MIEGLCQICKNFPKITQHAIIYCKSAKQVWKSTRWRDLINWNESVSIPKIVENFNAKKIDLLMDEFGAIGWSIWYSKNAFVHSDGPIDKEEIVLRGLRLVEDVVPNFARLAIGGAALSKIPRWIPPPLLCYKLNLDVSLNLGQMKFGFGFVIRNGEGRPVLDSCWGEEELLILEVKAKALLLGLECCVIKGLYPVQAAANNATLISLIQVRDKKRFEVDLAISDIQDLSNSVQSVVFNSLYT